jgi:hypothetical protein
MPGEDLPTHLQRPRSKNRLLDVLLDAAFSFTGPAQVMDDDTPQRGPRTEEEARSGYGQWDRVTVGGHSYLVERRPDAPGN